MRNSRWAGAAVAAATVLLLGGCAATTASDAATSPPATSAPILDTELRTQLEAALDEGFAASGMPGVIVGVWVPGEDEWVSERGVAEVGTDEPMGRDNQQKIGSITKTIVGTVMLQVIGEGGFDVSLDDTLDRWYPDFPEASNITVRMLLNHSSGIGEAGRAQVDRICAAPYAVPTPDQLIAVSAETPRADFAPGEGFEYANGNYFLLGGILEQVTGEDLATLIHDRITEPFGMDRSRFAPDGEVTAPLTHGYSEFCPELGETVDTVEWSNGESWAGGAMVSTLDDLHAWGEAIGAGAGVTPELQVARYADRAIISEETGSAYGLGAGVVYDAATGCVLIVSHAGAEPGYGTNIAYYPMTGAVLAMLGNGDGGDGDAATEVTKALAPVLGPVLYPTPTEPCAAPWG
ncbi:alkaline D-peptidase. Serine peptidase. MEROPS family S12 [Agromyces sp. CF514]|uniref:serine hydrolase domain-containing protein n=1 Tax=Agromyces sp. CF514 TaxID=1881031 RepID=UPI0008E6A7C3|nr:serine hydrolase domain-containing protein [Agromyces sp. CF514]SFR71138.1 alkaline D-peptidase. Serine peptidase. MEROPS family S12 [Agromyces sp. CF514]